MSRHQFILLFCLKIQAFPPALLVGKLSESFKKYLDIQNYDEEIEHLEMKYGMPYGRLYLIYCDEKLAGCIGLRKIDNQNCEMKRLYIRPEFRGKN